MKPIIKLLILLAGITLSLAGIGILTTDFTNINIVIIMTLGMLGVVVILAGLLAITASGAIDFLDNDIRDRIFGATKPTPIDYDSELQRLARTNTRLRQTIEEKEIVIVNTKQIMSSYIDQLNTHIRINDDYKTTLDVKETEILKLKAEIVKLTLNTDKGAPFDEPFPVPVLDDKPKEVKSRIDGYTKDDNW